MPAMRNTRPQPTALDLINMPVKTLAQHAESEAAYLDGQKQTAVPRLLRELAKRLARQERKIARLERAA